MNWNNNDNALRFIKFIKGYLKIRLSWSSISLPGKSGLPPFAISEGEKNASSKLSCRIMRYIKCNSKDYREIESEVITSRQSLQKQI